MNHHHHSSDAQGPVGQTRTRHLPGVNVFFGWVFLYKRGSSQLNYLTLHQLLCFRSRGRLDTVFALQWHHIKCISTFNCLYSKNYKEENLVMVRLRWMDGSTKATDSSSLM